MRRYTVIAVFLLLLATPVSANMYEGAITASWYGEGHHGQRTASGERFDRTALTAAHPFLPFGSLVEVRNLANGRAVVVRINDRNRQGIDLSKAAAHHLDMLRSGLAPVALRHVSSAGFRPD